MVAVLQPVGEYQGLLNEKASAPLPLQDSAAGVPKFPVAVEHAVAEFTHILHVWKKLGLDWLR